MSRRLSLALLAGIAAILGITAAGCGDTQTSATPSEQQRFEDPILEPPAGATPGGGAPTGAAPPPPPPANAQAGPG